MAAPGGPTGELLEAPLEDEISAPLPNPPKAPAAGTPTEAPAPKRVQDEEASVRPLTIPQRTLTDEEAAGILRLRAVPTSAGNSRSEGGVPATIVPKTTTETTEEAENSAAPGLIGPIGYDVTK